MTPAGRGLLVLGLVAGYAGTRLHWLELTTLSAVCLVALALALPQLLRPRPARVELNLRPHTTVAGKSGSGVVSVEAGAIPLLSPILSVSLDGRRTTLSLPSVRARTEHVEKFEVPAPHRGVYVVGPVVHEVSDLLGLLRRRVRWAAETELLVRPRTVHLDSLSTGVLSDLEGAPSSQLSVSDLAFHALREYTPGDDLRHVHWRSSARASTLLVRQYLETTRSHATVILDPDPASYVGEEDFELAVSLAASIALRAALDDFDVTWVTGASDLTSREPGTLLDSACRITSGVDDVVERARRTASVVRGTSLVAVVSGGLVDLARLRLASTAFGVQSRRLIVRAVTDRDSRLDEQDGVALVSIADLAHLGPLLSGPTR